MIERRADQLLVLGRRCLRGSGASVPVHSSISSDLTVTSLYPALMAARAIELVPEDAWADNFLAALRHGRNALWSRSRRLTWNCSAANSPPTNWPRPAKPSIGSQALPAESLAALGNTHRTPPVTNGSWCPLGGTPCGRTILHRGLVPIGRPIANTPTLRSQPPFAVPPQWRSSKYAVEARGAAAVF